jgi:hypothetical protein
MTPLKAFALVALCLALAGPAPAAPTPAPTCGRACLYQLLDRYLAALKAKDPSGLPWAKDVRNTENNVALRVGDGLWGTIASLGAFDLRFADPATGGVGFYGVVREGETDSPFGLRLKVRDGRITEVETMVSRPQDSGTPFTTAKFEDRPMWREMLAPKDRTPRARMIALADGYFSTLQRNDGTLHTRFAPGCDRTENGFRTTNNAEGARTYGANMALGCEAQFRTGNYRFDDRLRSRRYMVVDEERGLVMSAAFIDHSGRLGEYRLTDGTTVTSLYRRPHSFALLETFKIKDGRIEQVWSVFTSVPYRMPSPWVGGGFRYE